MEEKQEIVFSEKDDWEKFNEEFDEKRSHEEQRLNMGKSESFSAGIRKMLQRPSSDDNFPVKSTKTSEQLPQFDSIYEIAKAKDMTLQEFVQKDPQQALRMVENSYANWQNLLTSASITGGIEMPGEDGEMERYAVSKNQTKLIELRIREAAKQF